MSEIENIKRLIVDLVNALEDLELSWRQLSERLEEQDYFDRELIESVESDLDKVKELVEDISELVREMEEE